MEIIPFDPQYVTEAANLFVRNYRRLRQVVPALPDTLEDAAVVGERLGRMADGFLALQDGQVTGYLGWFVVDDFRGTGRRAAYCPEWGHASPESNAQQVYRGLYQAAAARWTEAGCKVHAISLLSSDKAAETTWFWSGFGLVVVDALRPMLPLQVAPPQSVEIRKADAGDAPAIAALDADHWRHYTTPPIFMLPRSVEGPEEQRQFLLQPHNSVWLATQDGQAAGFMRFEGESFGAAAIVRSPMTIAITGAYVRPGLRSQGVAAALLAAALRDYAAEGFERCSVDFESFNPEAAYFWMKYFQPVSLSLIRYPEALQNS
jgi:GNAT superfamily N-acetyltransferase